MSFNNIAAKKLTTIRQKATLLSKKFNGNLYKFLAIIVLILSVISILLSTHPLRQSSKLSVTSLNQKWSPYGTTNSPTNISHIVFGIAGSSKTWTNRKHYIYSWWQPNVTRGILFLDKTPIEHLPWPPISLRVRVFENTSKYKDFDKHAMPFAIRLVRVIAETFNAENKNIRWYVMADDDTVLFTSNLVEVLSRYDHRKYLYIGTNSECTLSNFDNSFEMAFGGAGVALSYPLVEALAKNLDVCIRRYPTLFGRDHILQSCVADLGVALTQHKGFHQIDLHKDISGLLSAHPPTPLLSLHHLEIVEPIFPSMNRYESVNHLMKAAKIDEPRLLQQSICYLKQSNWTYSISWGYSTHIYEKVIPPSILQRPLETFTQWRWGANPSYMFNTRIPSRDPCEAPHVFFFDSVEKTNRDNVVISSYIRRSRRLLPACSSSGKHFADHISVIRVISPVKRFEGVGGRRECCDVIPVPGMNATTVKLRTCMKDEIVA